MAYVYTSEERAIVDKMLSWQVCAACQGGCLYLQPHHVKTVGSGGKHPGNILPFCPNCHNAVHDKGRNSFEEIMNINMLALAKTVWTTAKEAVFGCKSEA